MGRLQMLALELGPRYVTGWWKAVRQDIDICHSFRMVSST